ncbi:MAG: hypothetical protein K6E51_03640 [Treponema sp.]|nr:hypothetical protein [Treponema sp.]
MNKNICPECYSEYSRISPLYNAEYCLKNHKQYICRTCGRVICIDENTEVSIHAKFTSENVARYLLRGAESYYKEECAVFKHNDNGKFYFYIRPIYGTLSKKRPAHFIPESYRQPVKKQTGYLSKEQCEQYLLEQNEERKTSDYAELLLCDDPQSQRFDFEFLSCKAGCITLCFKTKFESFVHAFYDDENKSIEESDFVILAKWLCAVSINSDVMPKVLTLYSDYESHICLKAEKGFLKLYEHAVEDEENLRISYFGSLTEIYENFRNALKTFIETKYNPAEWEAAQEDSDDEGCCDAYEGVSLVKIYDYLYR